MNIPKPSGKVHPVADMFPLMPEDELDELAADIKTNGLNNPIVLDKDGTLIDGRNRLAACKRAKITPTYILLDGQDSIAFILSQNINRRHLNQGQRAIIIAEALSESDKTQQVASKQSGVKQSQISEAKSILKYAPDLADAIVFGSGKFDPAYQIAKQRKEIAARNEANAARLQAEDTELWAKVQDDNDPMTLDTAIIELARRQRAAEEKKAEEAAVRMQQRMLSTQHLETAINYCEPHGYTPQEWAQRFVELFDPSSSREKITRERIEQSAEVLKHLSKIWPTLYGQE
jgi:ParB/RepB/Spo0J family partition protein